jgi:hypothetical protein
MITDSGVHINTLEIKQNTNLKEIMTSGRNSKQTTPTCSNKEGMDSEGILVKDANNSILGE